MDFIKTVVLLLLQSQMKPLKGKCDIDDGQDIVKWHNIMINVLNECLLNVKYYL